jgi:hypothetical protein
MLSLFKSRKFYIALAAICTQVGLLLTKQMDAKTFGQTVAGVLVAFGLSIAIEDNGTKGGANAPADAPAAPPAPESAKPTIIPPTESRP